MSHPSRKAKTHHCAASGAHYSTHCETAFPQPLIILLNIQFNCCRLSSDALVTWQSSASHRQTHSALGLEDEWCPVLQVCLSFITVSPKQMVCSLAVMGAPWGAGQGTLFLASATPWALRGCGLPGTSSQEDRFNIALRSNQPLLQLKQWVILVTTARPLEVSRASCISLLATEWVCGMTQLLVAFLHLTLLLSSTSFTQLHPQPELMFFLTLQERTDSFLWCSTSVLPVVSHFFPRIV